MFTIRYKTDKSKEAEKRSRLLVVVSSIMLLWVSWWYCFHSNPGLFVLTAVCALVAVSMSKTFPKNSRWHIWSWLIITILCIIVNITKLVPADGDVMSGNYLTNRFIIVFYAYALGSIFYCSGRLRISSISACCMPMAMTVLWESNTTQLTSLQKQIFLWGFILLFVLMDDLVQYTRTIKVSTSGTIKEHILRWTKYLIIIVAAILLSPKLELSAYKFQDFILKLDIEFLNSRVRNRQSEYLYLGASLPSNFHKREKLILLVDADRTPGYLREDVYVKYSKGQWYKGVTQTNQIDYVNQLSFSESDELVYSLSQYEDSSITNIWTFDVISPGYISAICLPGNALTLSSEDSSFTIDPNGAVYLEESNIMPDRYKTFVADRGVEEGIQQVPETFDKQIYLAIPTNMTVLVSEWVNSCDGLQNSTSVNQSVSLLQTYFNTNFKYDMSVRLKKSAPLIDFMKKKKGYCIHFASATALMLRSCGVPARVVGGFVCYEWNSWIKRFVVREREGHAWVEAWDNSKKRWITVETTPAAGIPDANDSPGTFRLTTDWLVFWWKRFLYALGQADVFTVAADFLTAVFLFVWQFLISIKGVLTLIIIALFVVRQKAKHKVLKSTDDMLREKLISTMCSLSNKMVDERLRRLDAESWDIWLLRIKNDLSPETYNQLADLVESYEAIRYQKKLDHAKANLWLE